jgi:hypothetical protein
VSEDDLTADNVEIQENEGDGWKTGKEVHRMKSGVENDLCFDHLKFRISVTRCWGRRKEYINNYPHYEQLMRWWGYMIKDVKEVKESHVLSNGSVLLGLTPGST